MTHIGEEQGFGSVGPFSFFFGLLRECLELGVVSEAFLLEEMALDHVRHDALDLIERTPRWAALS